MADPRAPALLVADPSGKVLEHPRLLATVRSGEEVLLAARAGDRRCRPGPAWSTSPAAVRWASTPRPASWCWCSEVAVGRRRFVPDAVGALLPPGWTRTYLPGEVKADGPLLAAVGVHRRGLGAERARSSGGCTPTGGRTGTRSASPPPSCAGRSTGRCARDPDNRVLRQLRTCALVYRCFTSQNLFLGRDEGAIPVSVMCNAACVGCISDQPEDGAAGLARADGRRTLRGGDGPAGGGAPGTRPGRGRW